VRANVPNIVAPDVVLEAWKFVPPVHYVVHDATGKSIVIEYVEGRLNFHDNPLGIMSNSPTFDWHMTNLRNYVNFSLMNVPPVQLGSVKRLPFGQGSGMLGLPGDFTPPSRFVRAAAFSQSVLPSQTGNETVLEAFHILNAFVIPKGAAREHEKDEHGNVLNERRPDMTDHVINWDDWNESVRRSIASVRRDLYWCDHPAGRVVVRQPRCGCPGRRGCISPRARVGYAYSCLIVESSREPRDELSGSPSIPVAVLGLKASRSR
jgi:hypothetical protein